MDTIWLVSDQTTIIHSMSGSRQIGRPPSETRTKPVAVSLRRSRATASRAGTDKGNTRKRHRTSQQADSAANLTLGEDDDCPHQRD
jgi:hypothetical protein